MQDCPTPRNPHGDPLTLTHRRMQTGETEGAGKYVQLAVTAMQHIYSALTNYDGATQLELVIQEDRERRIETTGS